MKMIRMPPRSTEEAVLMNACKKAKKEKLRLVQGRKPERQIEWTWLAQDMKTWYEIHEESRNKNDYATTHGYIPSEFRNYHREDQTFKEAWEYCVLLCLRRREEYLEKSGKLSQQYMEQLPLYDLELAEYKEKLKNTSDKNIADAVKGVFFTAIKETDELNEHMKKKGKE